MTSGMMSLYGGLLLPPFLPVLACQPGGGGGGGDGGGESTIPVTSDEAATAIKKNRLERSSVLSRHAGSLRGSAGVSFKQFTTTLKGYRKIVQMEECLFTGRTTGQQGLFRDTGQAGPRRGAAAQRGRQMYHSQRGGGVGEGRAEDGIERKRSEGTEEEEESVPFEAAAQALAEDEAASELLLKKQERAKQDAEAEIVLLAEAERVY